MRHGSQREPHIASLLAEYAQARSESGVAIGAFLGAISRDAPLPEIEAAAQAVRRATDRIAGAAHLLTAEGVERLTLSNAA